MKKLLFLGFLFLTSCSNKPTYDCYFGDSFGTQDVWNFKGPLEDVPGRGEDVAHPAVQKWDTSRFGAVKIATPKVDTLIKPLADTISSISVPIDTLK